MHIFVHYLVHSCILGLDEVRAAAVFVVECIFTGLGKQTSQIL